MIESQLPDRGDFIRITEELDEDFGRIGRVLWVTRSLNPSLRDVQITFSLFDDYLGLCRTLGPRDITILNAMELLAVVAQ